MCPLIAAFCWSGFVKCKTFTLLPGNLPSTEGKGSAYSITELIPVLGSQPAGDVSRGDRLPLLSARPAVTLATLKRAATNFVAW